MKWGVGVRVTVAALAEDAALLLGGSWVVISRVISRVTIVITHIRGLITPLITTHEPPSVAHRSKNRCDGCPHCCQP